MTDETVVTLGRPEDDPYLELGRSIAGQCPAGFEEARLEVDGANLSLACTPEAGGEVRPDIEPAAQARISALIARIRERDEHGWRRCTVTLRKGGGFAMDFHG